MQKKTNIQSALKRKYPEQVVLVTSARPEGGANVMAVGWVSIASGDPLMFALGIDDEAYTYELIGKSREFVVAFPCEDMAAAVLRAGSRHGRGIDKIAACSLKTAPATQVAAPILEDAVANFECVLAEVYRPGDCPIVIGKVVAAHENTNPAVRRLYTVAPGHKLAGVAPRQD